MLSRFIKTSKKLLITNVRYCSELQSNKPKEDYQREVSTVKEVVDSLSLSPHEEYIMIGKHMERPFTGILFAPQILTINLYDINIFINKSNLSRAIL